jgi:hypothetical protein
MSTTSKFLTAPEQYSGDHVYILIRGYDESTDLFDLCEYLFQPEHPLVLCSSDSDWFDFDDAKVSGHMLAFMCGEWGEPAELVGRVFKMPLPN